MFRVLKLKGPLKGLFEHANELIKFLSAPQPTASEQERGVNRESEKSDNVNMSEDVNKSGSVHGDDDAKSASDSETEDEKNVFFFLLIKSVRILV